MKKKLLSLMMAAAMVATTSVGAFAADKTMSFSDTQEQTTDIQITGDVADNSGAFLPGTISVTVPTTAAFKVLQDGQVIGSEIKVENTGNVPVDVSVNSFVDASGKDVGINVKSSNDLVSDKTTSVALKVRGKLRTVYLSSDTADQGVYSNVELTAAADDTTSKVLKVDSNTEEKLYLEGEAGKDGALPAAVRDNFTLTLKISKAK